MRCGAGLCAPDRALTYCGPAVNASAFSNFFSRNCHIVPKPAENDLFQLRAPNKSVQKPYWTIERNISLESASEIPVWNLETEAGTRLAFVQIDAAAMGLEELRNNRQSQADPALL